MDFEWPPFDGEVLGRCPTSRGGRVWLPGCRPGGGPPHVAAGGGCLAWRPGWWSFRLAGGGFAWRPGWWSFRL